MILKEVLLVLAGVGIFSASSAQRIADYPIEVTTATYGLQGTVVRMEQTRYTYDTEMIPGEQVRIVFNKNGKADSIKVQGEKISELTVYRYNGKGLMSSMLHFEKTRLRDSALFIYSRDGKLREWRVTDSRGRLQQKIQYRYNSKDQLIYASYRQGSGELDSMVRFKYEAPGNYRRSVFGNQLKFNTSQLVTQETDTDGHTLLHTYYYIDEDSSTGMMSKVLDTAGRMVQYTTTDASRRVLDYGTTTYNTYGDIDKEVLYTGEQKRETSYDYNYDTQGNWTTLKKYSEGKLLEAWSRVLEYAPTAEK